MITREERALEEEFGEEYRAYRARVPALPTFGERADVIAWGRGCGFRADCNTLRHGDGNECRSHGFSCSIQFIQAIRWDKRVGATGGVRRSCS